MCPEHHTLNRQRSNRALYSWGLRCLVMSWVGAGFVGCVDRQTEERKVSEDVTAKVRAEAAKAEMQQLPQTFKARYNQKIDRTDVDVGGTKQKSTSASQ
jgi:hypothetical protein